MDLDQIFLQPLSTVPKILNENQGVLTVALFILSILLGWISGLFKALRRKPDLKICVRPGPSFACVFGTGRKHDGYDTHSTGIALYLKISNVGISPTTITQVKVGYRRFPRNIIEILRLRAKWFFINEQSVAMSEFQVSIGEQKKIYPFLHQKSAVYGEPAVTYLEPGRTTYGVVYFEQQESWGGFYPRSRNFRTKVKIVILDSFGKRYRHFTKIDRVTLAKARQFNPKFGTTLAQLHGWEGPLELPLDNHGNLKSPKH